MLQKEINSRFPIILKIGLDVIYYDLQYVCMCVHVSVGYMFANFTERILISNYELTAVFKRAVPSA